MNRKFPQPPAFGSPRLAQNQQTNRMQPHRPGVTVTQPAVVVQRKATPVAPPPYRPQPAPKVLQTKLAVAHQSVKPGSRPVAPPVFRPNPAPKVLQAKPAGGLVSRGTQLPAARPSPPLKAPVLLSPPLNSSGVLQLKVEVQRDQDGKYKIKGRPRFHSFVTKELVATWNKAHPGDKLPLKGLNLTDEGLARCHKTSWSDIRGWVQSYLNKEMTRDRLTELTNTLYGDKANTSTEWKQMNGLRLRLFEVAKDKKSTLKQIETAASQLCSALNSATPNLRLDDSPTNSHIQQHFDPNMELTADGLRLSPTSRRQRAEGGATTPLRTPGGQHMYSSSVDGPFGKADSTPKTGVALFH